MGNNGSAEAADKVGYRVLGVQSNSPAAVGGLVSFFDFIVAANGVPLRTLDSTFVEIIKASEDKPLPLTVYNCKSHTLREIVLVPSRNWPGEGMLGVVIRFDSYHEADEHMCHVLEVEPHSPAELAGLQAQTDYLLGTAECAFKSSDDLYSVLQSNLEMPVEFYVYNILTDEVRICVLMPSTQWGGQGILGASVGVGYLHSFPASCCQTLGK
jgi:S1-C subfamily serine protease